jgi:class 3 adenylate cyclase
MSAPVLQLQATIAALEAQRPMLGDTVVDTALAPLRAQLAALQLRAPTAPAQALRLVSILFLDIVGSTALSRRLDPEETHAVMDGALKRCTAVVRRHGGKVLQYAGDNLLAVFGGEAAHEDDAERAVRCGLDLLAEGRQLGAEVQREHGHAGFDVRVGVHTGSVLLGGGVDAEGSIRGAPVNVAARMEQTAPPGGLRISQDTYRQVRGVFDVEPQPPIEVKGLAEPVSTYLVRRAKPRAFRTGTRGVEGVETRMVGRDAELQTLQAAFERLHGQGRLEMVLVVAEAGVGKSRLLYEFTNWAEARPEVYFTFQGRADPRTLNQPFGLLRDVLAWRLQIADTDSVAAAKAKVEAGIAPLFLADDGPELAQAHAHLLGHLIGLDYSDSPHVKGILDDPRQIRQRAFHAAAQAFRRFSALGGASGRPIVLQLDDLHWSDDGSLEFLKHLLRVNRDVPMLIVGLTRPTLFERREDWREQVAAGSAVVQRIHLRPLDASTSQALTGELLKRLPSVPAALSALIIGRADGNPFYMEELVKMLVDQGALLPGPEAWSLNAERLLAAAVPPTLTGVLQARLDGLPAAEKLALQQASVVGLVFWAQALAALDANAAAALPALVRRELTLPREQTSLDGVDEYGFKHQILHEVTYDTVLKRMRRDLHLRAAEWFAGLTGVRATGLLGSAAWHFERGGEPLRAAEFYARAAEESRKRYAHESVLSYVASALALLHAEDDEQGGEDLRELRWRLLDCRERTLELQGRRPEQRADLDTLQALADSLHDLQRQAEVASRRSLLAGRSGDYAGQEAAARQALSLASHVDDPAPRLNAQRLLADALARQGDVSAAEALACSGLADARAAALPGPESRFLNALAIIAARRNDLVAVLAHSQQATRLRRELGDRRNEAIGLSTLGGGWLELGDFEQARQDLVESLRLHRAMGDRAYEPIAMSNLAQLALWEGDATGARDQARAAVAEALDVQAPELHAFALWCLGQADMALGRLDAAQAAYAEAQAVALAIGGAQRHDAAAGLARVALARSDVTGALTALAPVVEAIAAGDALDGTLGLTLVQLTVWQGLSAAGDERAWPWLDQAHLALQARAAELSDPALRASFLGRVPPNRELVAAWAAAARRR